MDSKLIEVLKEALRVVVLAVVSFLLTDNVVNNLVVFFGGKSLEPQLVIITTGLILSILRGVEKELHSKGSKVTLPF